MHSLPLVLQLMHGSEAVGMAHIHLFSRPAVSCNRDAQLTSIAGAFQARPRFPSSATGAHSRSPRCCRFWHGP